MVTDENTDKVGARVVETTRQRREGLIAKALTEVGVEEWME